MPDDPIVTMSNGQPRPSINPIKWTPVSTVLPNEARDFTPWLAENLGLLGPSLGLDDLTLVATEYQVLGFSLDLLAQSVGPDGQPVWVAIENQYGRTDHSHLGQLITYTAHAAKDQDRVLAVWITEEAHPAHLAAVELLNRSLSQSSGLGYMLLQVRFVPGPEDTYHVFFQVLASPNAFLQEGIQTSGSSASAETRRSFMASMYETIEPRAKAAGAQSTWFEKNGWQISLRFAAGSDLATWPMEIWVRMSATDVTVSLSAFSAAHTAEENRAALDVVRANVGAAVDQALPAGTTINWHAGYAEQATDHAQSAWGQGGYSNGDAEKAADWAASVAGAWLSVLTTNPIVGLADDVAQRIATQAPPPSDIAGTDGLAV